MDALLDKLNAASKPGSDPSPAVETPTKTPPKTPSTPSRSPPGGGALFGRNEFLQGGGNLHAAAAETGTRESAQTPKASGSGGRTPKDATPTPATPKGGKKANPKPGGKPADGRGRPQKDLAAQAQKQCEAFRDAWDKDPLYWGSEAKTQGKSLTKDIKAITTKMGAAVDMQEVTNLRVAEKQLTAIMTMIEAVAIHGLDSEEFTKARSKFVGHGMLFQTSGCMFFGIRMWQKKVDPGGLWAFVAVAFCGCCFRSCGFEGWSSIVYIKIVKNEIGCMCNSLGCTSF
jgi:hypothetical protein